MERLRAIWSWISEPAHRFIPLFLACLWVLTELTDRIPEPAIDAFLQATTWVDYQLTDLFFDRVTQRGTTLTLDGFSVQVITECTGLLEAVILAAAMLAYPATWRERGIGLAVGVALLYSINVIRIAVLLIVGRFARDYFDFAHVYFWQSLLIVFITAIWLAWIRYVVSDDAAGPPTNVSIDDPDAAPAR